MATGFLSQLTSALKSGNGNAQSSQSTRGNNSQTYDAHGNPIVQGNSNPNGGNNNSNGNFSSSNGVSQNQNQNQNQNNQSNESDPLLSLYAPLDSVRPGDQNSGQNNQNQNQNPAPADPQSKELAPGFTAKDLVTKLQGVQFSQSVPAETIQQALGGDVNAFSAVLNQVAQLAAAIAVQQSSELSTSLLDSRLKEFDSRIDSRFSVNSFRQILNDKKYSNPVIQPMVKDIMARIIQKEPNITPDQMREALPLVLQRAIASIQPADQGNNSGSNNPSPRVNQMTGNPQPSNDSNIVSQIINGEGGSLNFDDMFS